MSKYTVTVKANNPEFKLDDKIENGIDCAGCVVIGFDEDGDPVFNAITGTSIMDLAHFFVRSQCTDFMEAFYIAEGLRKAYDYERNVKKNRAQDTAKILGAIMKSINKEEEDDE